MAPDDPKPKRRRFTLSDRATAFLMYGLAWFFGGVALGSNQVLWVVPMVLCIFAFALYAPRLEKGSSL